MKVLEFLLIGAMVALVAVTLPVASQTVAADVGSIEKLVPAESAEVETGGGETAWVLMEPVERGHDTFSIEKLVPAESAFVEAEIGAGETASVLLAPSERGHDTGRIELLLPAD